MVSAYVNEGFNFLAVKLVVGVPVSAMRPVRITTPGAGLMLPLRMVAAGTGAVTPISLWMWARGGTSRTNFPSFLIRSSDLIWDWGQQRSNYAELKQAGFDETNGAGWLIEAGEPIIEVHRHESPSGSRRILAGGERLRRRERRRGHWRL